MTRPTIPAAILTLVLSLWTLVPTGAQAPVDAWTSLAQRVKASVVFLEHCSGFVIDAEKKHVLTAAHCLPEDETKILVDGARAYRVFMDQRKDLLVLRAPQTDKPALRLADKTPIVGEEVASLGFGFAFEQPMFRVAHVSVMNLEAEELGSGPFMLLDQVLVPGQSGGPIVNRNGEVVAIVQMTIPGFGIGIGRYGDTLRDRVGRYFGK